MKRAAIAAAFVILSLSFIFLVALSPLLLGALLPGTTEALTRLSNIGQAYGSISALLSAVALLGVVYSTFIQIRQTKVNQIQLFRGLHTQLLERVMGDPGTYAPAVSDFDTHSGDAKALRRRLHFVLYMNYHWAIYERGELREDAVRFDLLEPLFRSPIARSLWVTVRPYWQAVQGETRKGRRFLTMVDDELAKAVQRDEDADDPHDDSDNT